MTWWSAGLALFAVLVLFVIPAWGALRFKPQHARNVKYVENVTERVVQQNVVLVAPTHPEIVRVSRLDRHWFFILPHGAVLGYAICVFAGAELTSNVRSMGESQRYTMAGSFLFGSALVLISSAMGAKLGRWRFVRRVFDHPTMDVLGDDISLPYRLAGSGLGVVAVGLTIYSSTSFASTTGSLGGWLTGALALASALVMVQLFRRIRSFEKEDTVLILEALQRMDDDGQLDG